MNRLAPLRAGFAGFFFNFMLSDPPSLSLRIQLGGLSNLAECMQHWQSEQWRQPSSWPTLWRSWTLRQKFALFGRTSPLGAHARSASKRSPLSSLPWASARWSQQACRMQHWSGGSLLHGLHSRSHRGEVGGPLKRATSENFGLGAAH